MLPSRGSDLPLPGTPTGNLTENLPSEILDSSHRKVCLTICWQTSLNNVTHSRTVNVNHVTGISQLNGL